MRRRLLTALVGVTALALVLVTVPFGFLLDRTAHDEARARIERQAELLTAQVESRLAEGRPLTAEGLGRLVPARARVDVMVAGSPTIHAGEPEPEDPIAVSVPGVDGIVVRLVASGDGVQGRVHDGVVTLVGVALVVLAAAAGVALWQSRRLVAPLRSLGEQAARLGSGDFSVRAGRCGMTEVDELAAVLDVSADRIGALVEAERRFSSDASHQLRSALTGLRLRVEMLALSGDDVTREQAGEALGQIDRLTATVGALLHLAREGRAGLTGPVDLGELAAAHVADVRAAAARTGRRIELAVDTARGRPTATCSAGGVAQALDVLLWNAVEHGGGTVRVVVGPAGEVDDRVAVTVVDAGPGVPAARVDEVFRGASRADGRGLGLALARRAIEADGGSLELVTGRGGHDVPGAIGMPGAAFRITLPRTPEAGDAADRADTADTAHTADGGKGADGDASLVPVPGAV